MGSRTVKYTAGKIGRVKVVEDFLPSPDALANAIRTKRGKARRVGKRSVPTVLDKAAYHNAWTRRFRLRGLRFGAQVAP